MDFSFWNYLSSCKGVSSQGNSRNRWGMLFQSSNCSAFFLQMPPEPLHLATFSRNSFGNRVVIANLESQHTATGLHLWFPPFGLARFTDSMNNPEENRPQTRKLLSIRFLRSMRSKAQLSSWCWPPYKFFKSSSLRCFTEDKENIRLLILEW